MTGKVRLRPPARSVASPAPRSVIHGESDRPSCRLTASVCRHSMPLSRAGAVDARGGQSCAPCLRLQRVRLGADP